MPSRLGFPTALLNEASLPVIDEVLSVGDQELRARAEAALENQFSGQRAVVIVSHVKSQVESFCRGSFRLK